MTTTAIGTALLEDEEFVSDEIRPLASYAGWAPPSSSRPTVTVLRRGDDGPLEAEYSFGRSVRVVAKLYPEPTAGAAAFRIHESLWLAGLGAGSAHRVPQPLGYLSEHGVLVLGPTSGAQLGDGPLPKTLVSVRRAARWLACLHRAPVDLDSYEDEAQAALRVARRAATATAVRPDLEGVVRELLETLAARYPHAFAQGERVPTHGSFSVENIYAAPTHVTAVDLDRAALADPAKDVGELLHSLRWNAQSRGGSSEAVDAACAAFVREYRRYSRSVLASIEYHWSSSVVGTLLALASRHRSGPDWDEGSAFLLAELDEIPQRTDALLELA